MTVDASANVDNPVKPVPITPPVDTKLARKAQEALSANVDKAAKQLENWGVPNDRNAISQAAIQALQQRSLETNTPLEELIKRVKEIDLDE